MVYKWYINVTIIICDNIKHITPRRYPYFDVVVGLEWSQDPESYAGGSVNYW